jgi:alkylhydroperoxidase family enzyme
MTATQVTGRARGPVGREGLLEVCARHADELAGQVEAAERAVAAQLRRLARCEVRAAHASGECVAATLRVVADSLGELHTVLDEAAARGMNIGRAIGSEGDVW